MTTVVKMLLGAHVEPNQAFDIFYVILYILYIDMYTKH